MVRKNWYDLRNTALSIADSHKVRKLKQGCQCIPYISLCIAICFIFILAMGSDTEIPLVMRMYFVVFGTVLFLLMSRKTQGNLSLTQSRAYVLQKQEETSNTNETQSGVQF